jgi:hypothetical protein
LSPSGGFFIRELPTLALHGIHSDIAENYHLKDYASTGGMVIPSGITRSYRQGIHRKNGYSARNYKLRDDSRTRNPLENGTPQEITNSTDSYRQDPERSKCANYPPNGNNFRFSNSKSNTMKKTWWVVGGSVYTVLLGKNVTYVTHCLV